MNNPLSFADQLAFVTTKLECRRLDGTTALGTGFFYKLDLEEKKSVGLIITNKHVVETYDSAHFRLNAKDANGNPKLDQHISINLNSLQKDVIWHPDPSVDLCAIPADSVLTAAHSLGTSPFVLSIDRGILPTTQSLAELSAIEDILMVGYPTGLSDTKNNLPIFRKGITATHPNVNYEGRAEFLIDAACFGGSSGSPVFLYNTGIVSSKSGIKIGGSRLILLGILYAGPMYSAEGQVIIVNVPTNQKPLLISQIPMNLGFVIKAERLLEFEEPVRKWIKSGRITPHHVD